MKKILFTICSFLLVYQMALGQDISGNTNWKDEKDFRETEDQVVDNIKWLQNNPNIDDDNFKKQVGIYIMKWLIECTYLKIEMDTDFLVDIKDNEYKYSGHMTIAYLFGLALYAIENQEEDFNQIDSRQSGILSMIKTYESICEAVPEDCKNKVLEKLISLNENDELKDYIQTVIEEKSDD